MTTSLHGQHFKYAVVAAAQRVIQMQDHLNEINVFPVADADTGTNMALTLRSVAEAVWHCKDASLSELSAVVARAAFSGARGSSGAILAQYFQGLSEWLEGSDCADTVTFAQAAMHAAMLARQATAAPREGTILTVMQDWAVHLRRACERVSDFRTLLEASLPAARQSLQSTPERLATLTQAGVVDAGAQGFVYMLEGAAGYVRSGQVEEFSARTPVSGHAHGGIKAAADIPFRYCTQATLTGAMGDRQALLEELRPLGDSLIVARSNENVHIHIHTNDAEGVLARARAHGTLIQSRKEDMRAQHALAQADRKPRSVAIITDSSCDMPQGEIRRYGIRVVPHTVSFGSDSYLENVTLTHQAFYELLDASPHFPRTAHAAPADFHNAFVDAAANHDEAIVIMLSGALSGALSLASKTAEAMRDQIGIVTIDSKTTSVGLALVVREAAQAVESGNALPEIKRRVDWAIQKVRIFVSVETVEYLIRGGRVPKLRGFIARSLNMKPILSISAEGRVQVAAKPFGSRTSRRKLLRLVQREAEGKRNVRFLIAHANAPDTATYYAERIRDIFGVAELPIVPVSSAFGAHLGAGAAAVAFLEQYPRD